MKLNRIILISLLSAFVFLSFSCSKMGNNEPRTRLFDDNWLFLKGNPQNAESVNYDDSNWRQIDLPHDWSIEDLPNQSDSVIGPFTKSSPWKMKTGYTIGGTGWYRKHFTIEKIDEGKKVFITFEGVYMNSDVWINGQHVGNYPYGYNSFYYDITPYLNPVGKSNTIAVQVKNEGGNARWYSGSGIYRHTWLTLVKPIHIDMWGVFVTTPKVSKESATVNIASSIVNDNPKNVDAVVKVEIIDVVGNVVGESQENLEIPSGATKKIEQSVVVSNPLLWSIDAPNLYVAKVTVLENGKPVDAFDTKFGVRSLKFSADKGFLLNDKPIELVGGCFHHANGPLGSKAINRAEERKMELFKEAGLNAIRCSHNPPSPYLLSVCDSIGLLVIDEIFDNWEVPKVSDKDYSMFFKKWWKKDLESMIRRDRNHPSVIMWSFGNEIHESLDTIEGMRITKNMVNTIRNLDTSRAITLAYNDFSFLRGDDQTKWHNAAPIMEHLDVVGYNYLYDRYESDHKLYPERIIVATEFGPLRSLINWRKVEELPYVIGNFAWVIMDYLGESGVGVSKNIPEVPLHKRKFPPEFAFFSEDSWPVHNDFQGDIDLIGNKKPRYYHQLVVWRKSNIEMLVHEPIPANMKEITSNWGWPNEMKCWTWSGYEGDEFQVNIYTRYPLVKLELNGNIIGEQHVDGVDNITASFKVPYEPGVLIAHCYNIEGNEVDADTIQTVGKPSAIRLVADRTNINADRNDLSYITVEIVDKKGNLIPNADSIMVNFEITENAEIAGVGSGSPSDMESFQQPKRRTWHGRCLAIVRPKGKKGSATLSAHSEGLKPSSLEIIMNK